MSHVEISRSKEPIRLFESDIGVRSSPRSCLPAACQATTKRQPRPESKTEDDVVAHTPEPRVRSACVLC
jgi:hypothetical protein